MRRDTIFRISSMTKPVAAAAAMILVDEGRLALDEPVGRLLPELASPRVLTRLDGPIEETVPAARAILVEDLMTMRLGIGAIMAPGEFPINAAMAERGIGVGPRAAGGRRHGRLRGGAGVAAADAPAGGVLALRHRDGASRGA